jgi:hypothetical protein
MDRMLNDVLGSLFGGLLMGPLSQVGLQVGVVMVFGTPHNLPPQEVRFNDVVSNQVYLLVQNLLCFIVEYWSDLNAAHFR